VLKVLLVRGRLHSNTDSGALPRHDYPVVRLHNVSLRHCGLDLSSGHFESYRRVDDVR
jgi:hypothetical protein